MLVGKGTLINDGIAWAILSHTMSFTETSNGFIVDGYPRTLPEAEIMELSGFNYDCMISLTQHEDVILQKLLGRRVCEDCGTNFNVAEVKHEGYVLPARMPQLQGICDHCQGKLVKRADDSRRIIKRRQFEFKVKTAPLGEYFRNKGKMLEMDVYAGVNAFPILLEKVKERLGIN